MIHDYIDNNTTQDVPSTISKSRLTSMPDGENSNCIQRWWWRNTLPAKDYDLPAFRRAHLLTESGLDGFERTSTTK